MRDHVRQEKKNKLSLEACNPEFKFNLNHNYQLL